MGRVSRARACIYRDLAPPLQEKQRGEEKLEPFLFSEELGEFLVCVDLKSKSVCPLYGPCAPKRDSSLL